MVIFVVCSVFGKLLARHVIVACWCIRDKFLITNLLVCVDANEKSIIALSTWRPFNNHVTSGNGVPPLTSHNKIISAPSSYGPAIVWTTSPRSFRIFGFCGGTANVRVLDNKTMCVGGPKIEWEGERNEVKLWNNNLFIWICWNEHSDEVFVYFPTERYDWSLNSESW